MIAVREIKFGDYDARSEFFQQSRNESRILINSFQIPPSVVISELANGAKFFIYGSKGCGKTALIWYLKDAHEQAGGRSEVVLFKSNLTEGERQRLIKLTDVIIVTDQSKISFEYDYKQNWMWFIIRSLVRLIKDEDVLFGLDVVKDLRRLLAVNSTHQSIFSGLQLTKIKAALDAGLKTGPFQSKLQTEIEISNKLKDNSDVIEIINACERALSEVKLKKERSCKLFFDELELFMGVSDQHTRDLH